MQTTHKNYWRRLSERDTRGVTPHTPASAAPSTPAQRQIEIQQQLTETQGALAAAVSEIDRLEDALRQYHSFSGTSFGGIPMAQHWCDLILWEALLNDHTGLRAIVELGTWKGGFAWWLHAQAAARHIEFATYDVEAPANPPGGTYARDIFRYADEIRDTLWRWEPLILFCDNGNKPRELREFGTALHHPDSIVVVHDWGTEVGPGDVPNNLEMIWGDYCDALGSISRVFRKRREDDQ